MPGKSERPIVAGVGISHPDRTMFPAADISKLDLARYYDTIGEWMVPHLEDRPLTACAFAKRPSSVSI